MGDGCPTGGFRKEIDSNFTECEFAGFNNGIWGGTGKLNSKNWVIQTFAKENKWKERNRWALDEK